MIRKKNFDYGLREIEHLMEAEPVLGAAIKRLGRVEREVTPDPFVGLAHSIVAQLISTKAATSIWERLILQLGDITPDTISASTPEQLRACGMTLKKSESLIEIARKITAGELRMELLQEMADDEIVSYLTALKGVGRWTAEMVLILSLERPNIVSWGDIAIRRGVMKLHGLSDINREQFDELTRPYAPYGSVASIYLWEISHRPESDWSSAL